MLAPPRKPDGQPSPSPNVEPDGQDMSVPFAERRGREQAKRARRGCPFKIRDDRSLYPTSRLRFVVRRRPQC